MKKEIWISENKCGRVGAENEWETCTRHFSKSAATKAAKQCEYDSGERHRVRKHRPVKRTTNAKTNK